MTVSIIIPAYNCEAYIAATLRSVMQQTEPDLEIIVVDDGSSDTTLAIAQAAAAKDARLCVVTQTNQGTAAAARNRGLRLAQGEFVAFLDSDDLYHPEKIARELAAFARCPELDAVFSDVIYFDDDPHAATNVRCMSSQYLLQRAAAYLTQHSDTLYLCKANFYNFMSTQITAMSTQTVMLRRALLAQEHVAFREDWPVGEDIDLWFRLARRARLGYLDEALAYYRQRSQSLMTDEERALLGFIRAHSTNLQRGSDVFSAAEVHIINQRLARQYFNLGYYYFRQGRKREARTAYSTARDYDESAYSRSAYLKTYVPAPVTLLVKRAASAWQRH
ncbi:MAG: glycosyltransferase [Gammaproteobacteria bacterium]|nr:glycosyltransferase [Gammaproteobacteria bacterium]